MMRQLVGAGVELAHRSALCPRTPPRRRRASAPTWAANSSGKVAAGTATRGVVPLAQDGVALRRGQNVEAADRPVGMLRPPPPAAAPAAPPAPRRWRGRTGRWRIRARPSIPAGVPSAPRCSPRLSDRSNLAVAVATGSNAARQPRQVEADRGVVLERQHHLEQRMAGQRARRVEHLDQPLERQVLMAVGGEIGGAHPRDQLAEARIAATVSVRSTRVLTKKPTRSSSALSVRPAIGLPIGMSVPAPSRVSRAASAGLQHHEQARPAVARQRQQAAMQLRRRASAATLSPR